jgi:hypothetical protein
MEATTVNTPARVPWNKGKFTGQNLTEPPCQFKKRSPGGKSSETTGVPLARASDASAGFQGSSRSSSPRLRPMISFMISLVPA